MFLPSILSDGGDRASSSSCSTRPAARSTRRCGAIGLGAHKLAHRSGHRAAAIMAMDVWAARRLLRAGPVRGVHLDSRDRYYEAPSLDRSGHWATFQPRHTFPCLKPAIGFVLVINTIRSFQVFVEVLVMTAGGRSARPTRLVMLL
jgi:hypothetical protein